jgi:hypothetical protein
LFAVSLAISVFGVAVILSFSNFFFQVPFQGRFAPFREVFAFVSQIGWVLLLLVPPIMLRKIRNWSASKSIILISSVIIYPASLLVLKIYFTITFGNAYAGYLLSFPALFLLEWVVPAFYVICAIMLRRTREADDVIGIVAKYYEKNEPNTNVYVVSGDNDFLQLGNVFLVLIEGILI